MLRDEERTAYTSHYTGSDIKVSTCILERNIFS